MNGTVFFGKMEHQNIARNLGQDGDRACASYKEMALKCCQFFLKGGGGEFLKHKLYYIKDKKNFISLFLFYLKRLIPSSIKSYVKSLYIWKTRKVLFKDDLIFLKNEGI